ncbi:MAG: membrane integrity-associated transporter subunit PqiC [Nitrospira sp.]|nr:membrane integrity-associated transporter subunit PqiC [Nitrospira sp.]
MLRSRVTGWVGLVLAVYTASGCVLPRSEDSAVRTFVLMREETDREAAPAGAPAGMHGVLVVAVPQAAPGFEQPRIAYLRRPSEVSYYANHVWADSPSRMVLPLLVRSLDTTGLWRTVVPMPTGIKGDYQLDLSGLVVQQEFLQQPSRSRVQVRAHLVDVKAQRVLGARNFEALEPAPSEDAYGGVLAADRAVATVLATMNEWIASCLRGSGRETC